MKQAITGLLILVLAVAIMVAGYYFGIILAILGAILTGIAIVSGAFLFICYVVWEILFKRKRRQKQ